MKHKSLHKSSRTIYLFLLILILFLSAGFLFNKNLPAKWFVKYSIDTDIKLSAISEVMNNVLLELGIKSKDVDSLEVFVNEQIKKTDIRFISDKFSGISKPILDSNSIIFYTNDLNNIDQKIEYIVNQIEKQLKPQIFEWIVTYKIISERKLEFSKQNQIQEKINALNFYNSKKFKDNIDAEKERQLLEYEAAFKKFEDKNSDTFSVLANYELLNMYTRDPKSLVEFDLEMLKQNKAKDYEFLEIVQSLELDLKDLKVIKLGKMMTKFDKKPSLTNSLITFSIIGFFVFIMFILLTSKFSKQLKTRMSSFLLDPK